MLIGGSGLDLRLEFRIKNRGTTALKDSLLLLSFFFFICVESRDLERERERGTAIMSDEEHQFDSQADAGASKTYPQQAGTIRKNGYIVIKSRPCKVPLFHFNIISIHLLLSLSYAILRLLFW